MLTRSALAASVESFDTLRRKQSSVELVAFIAVMAGLFLISMLGPRTTVLPLAVGGVVGFSLVAWLITRNIKKAKQESGLVCPSCAHAMDHMDALYAALHDKCKKCGKDIMAPS